MPLVFNEERHEYTLDGVPLRNVTGILRRAFNLQYPPGPHRVIGKQVHKATELLDRGQRIKEMGEPIALRIKSYIHLAQDHPFEWDTIEEAGYDPELMVAGTVDRVGTLFGNPCVLDFKNGLTGPETALQTAAYTRIVFPRSEWLKVRRFKAHLQGDGSPAKLVEYKDPNDFSAWASMCEVDAWMLKNKIRSLAA